MKKCTRRRRRKRYTHVKAHTARTVLGYCPEREGDRLRRFERTGNFMLYLVINLLINLEWSLPAWILLALHFILGWSIWLFVAALAAWLLWVAITMGLLGLASRLANSSEPQHENKNPYSRKNSDVMPQLRKDQAENEKNNLM